MKVAPVRAPHVAIVLLNWNGWRDTVACLDALKLTRYPAGRVLVVDNGSSDDSVSRIREAHPEVELLETGKNLGFGAGNNRGIRHAIDAGAEYLWLLNTDTVPDPDALGALVAFAETDPQVGAVGSVLYHLERPDEIQAWGGGTINLWTGVSRTAVRSVDAARLDYLTAASLLLRSRAIDPLAAFDEKYFMYWEDVDLSFRLRRDGWRLGVAPDSRVLHRESSSLRGRGALLDRYTAASLVCFLRSHAPLPVVPMTLGLGAKLARRVLCADWARAAAVIRGVRDAWIDRREPS